MNHPRYGERVRVLSSHGPTGRYLGYFKGKHLAGWVSAQDNDLCIGEVVEGEPHPSLPVPSDDAVAGMASALCSKYAQ